MYNFLQRNKRKLMAFFAVGLMIVFILPAGISQMSNPGRIKLGSVDGQTIRLEDVALAQRAWADAASIYIRNPNAGFQQNAPEWQPLLTSMFQGVSDEVLREIEQNPEAYHLLVREADLMGVRPDMEQAREALTSESLGIRLPGTNTITAFDAPVVNPGLRERYAYALATLLAVNQAYDRAGSMLKVSAPLERRELAAEGQMLTLGVHEVPVREFVRHDDPKSDEQIRAQFDRFADVAAGTISESNPLGFGYRLPDAIKLQYLAFDAEAIREVVLASKPLDRWKVDAYRHYLRNPQSYPGTTPPATQPTTPDLLSLGKPPAPAPTTAPFEEVTEQAMEAVLRPEIDRFTRNLAGRTTLRMQTDFAAWKAATDTKSPAPASSIGPAYDSFEYLEALARNIESEFKIRPKLVNLANEWITQANFEEVGEIASAFIPPEGANGRLTFAQQLFFQANPALNPALSEGLRLLEPTKPMRDFENTTFVARLAGARPAQKATDLSTVREQIIADLHLADAVEAAKRHAEQLVASLAGRSLESANLPRFIRTEPFAASMLPPSLAIAPASREIWRTQLMQLLQAAASQDRSKPAVAAVVLPAQPWAPAKSLGAWENLRESLDARTPRVLLVELLEARGEWTDDRSRTQLAQALGRGLLFEFITGQRPEVFNLQPQEIRNRVAENWLDFRAIAKRANYVPAQAERLAPPPTPAEPGPTQPG
jgi:hypothetical protein